MSHRKVLSQGNVPFSWEEKPSVSKFSCFRDFEALALRSSPAPPSFFGGGGGEYCDPYEDDVVCKIPPPPCRLQPRRPVGSSGGRWEEDPFQVAYKECTKSVKNGKFVKKSKFFGFSCKSVGSCEIREGGNFFKLPSDRIGNRRFG